MPRIPFTDLASAPEFKSLPVEEQQKVSENYWNEVATEQPDRTDFFKGVGETSKTLFDLKAKRADAPPVQRRALDSKVQDLAFNLSVASESAMGRLTEEGYEAAVTAREAETAEQRARVNKTMDLFSDDPAKQRALAVRLDGLEQTATTGGIFGKMPFNEIVFNTGGASRDAYAALKDQTAKDYGLEPDEVDDIVKHRMGLQEKPVSMDALGNPFIKPEILAQGPDAVKDAILKSELPWREKQRMTEKGDLKERMDGYYKDTMARVAKDHPELHKLFGLDVAKDDPGAGFPALVSGLNSDFGDKFASGFTGYTFGAAEEVAPALAVDGVQVRAKAKLEGRDPDQAVEEARNQVRKPMTFARRAQESVNQLSREFYKDQGTLWGVDGSAYGSGAGSVLTAVGLGMATGPLSIAPSAARAATMGPTALRMLNGANSVMKASPSIGLAMAQTGTSTYEQAIKSGKTEEEAGELATLAGATEGVITGAFSLFGAGGVEAVGEQLLGTAARTAVKESAKNVVRNFGGKLVKGIAAEQFEENMIAAFDAATVQARINPNMTVEDFQNTLRETALVTLAVSGPTVGSGSLKEALSEKATYEQTTEEIKLRADLDLANAADPLRDIVRREGGVGTPLGAKLRRPATQPSEANLPPGGQGTPDASPDSGAVAPGAPGPVAPGGTQPVAPVEPVAAQAVPGVQPAGPAGPVLVPADAGVTDAPVETAPPELPPKSPEAAQAHWDKHVGAGKNRATKEELEAYNSQPYAVGETFGLPVYAGPRNSIPVNALYEDNGGVHKNVEIDGVKYRLMIANDGSIHFSANQSLGKTGRGAFKTMNELYPHFAELVGIFDKVNPGKTYSIAGNDTAKFSLFQRYAKKSGYEVKGNTFTIPAAVAPEQEVTEPITQPTEAEPDYRQVFETLRERGQATKQVDTESPQFKELVSELKNNRVAEAAGKLEQRKADIAKMRADVEKERTDRNNARLKRNREKAKSQPLDQHRKRIIELTKDDEFPEGRNPNFQKGLRAWLRAHGYDASIKKKGFLDGLLGYVRPLNKVKRERLYNLYASLTPDVKEMLDAIYKKPEKGAERIPLFEEFEKTPIGEALLADPIRSLSSYRDTKEKPPIEYEGLVENRIKGHAQSRIFTRHADGRTIADVVDILNTKYDKGQEGSMIDTQQYTAEDIIKAIYDLSDGKVVTEDDADTFYEKKLQGAEDREIAFAEQQLKALENDVQTVDLREVRKGDVFTLGGVEYTATGVETDKRGNTEEFKLSNPEGPLHGTTVTEDFFAESVTPTEGSLSHVDPAEIEAIYIAQQDDSFAAAEAAPEPQFQTPPPQAPQSVGAEPVAPEQAQTPPAPPVEPPAPPTEPTPAEESDEDLAGVRNAMTAKLREKVNMPPRAKEARLTNEAAWDAAMDILVADPEAGFKLVESQKKFPTSLTPVETALYTHELLTREQAFDKALARYNAGQNPETEFAFRNAGAAVADAVITAERIGTIEGRALQARKILIHQDFSLARVISKMTAANGGKELSKQQMEEAAELHKKLQEIQTQLDAANAQLAKQEAERIHVTVVTDYKKGLKEAKSRGEKGPGFIDRQAEAALARIKARRQEGRLNSLPLDELLDHAIVGVRYIKNGLVTIGEFTTQLVKDFGRKVLPFARDIFAKSQELYSAAAPSSKVKSREDVLEDIDPKAPLNDKAIFQLVRHYINEGVDGFEPVMQAVLTDLREFYPDLTLREVHDAYSKYGQTRTLSQEDDLKLAREYKELSRLQSQLEDAERGLAPLKTGLIRDNAEQNVRDLTKRVKDTMRNLGIRPTTDEGQLKSSFDAIKTRLQNEYEDLDTAIRKGEERRERSPQTFTPAEEAELKDLRQKRDDRKADYEAIFKKKGLTDAERIERAERLLDRRIAEERAMLEKGILKRNREMLMGPFSPALKSRREILEKLKAERRELQKAARPKTPEIEKKYKRDLASLERRIKEEEKLLAEGLTARQKDIKMGKWTPEMAEMQARLDAFRDARRELAESRKPAKDEAAAAYERATKAIEASIQRYKDILAGKAKADPGKKFTVDAEMTSLMDQRGALRDAAAALRAMDPARIDKRKQAVLKALDKSIVEITRKIQDGDLSTKGRTDFFASDPDVAKIRAARDLLNKTLEAMRKDALPKRTPEEIRASRDQKLIESKIAKLKDRLARDDYAKKPKLPPPDYTGRDALLKEKKKLESEFNQKLLDIELANRSLPQRLFDDTYDVVFGVSRAMLTSFDTGAFGRQAGLVNFMRPGLAVKNFPANFAFTEKKATEYEVKLESDPRWARNIASGLALTSWRPGHSFTAKEEMYESRIADKIPGVMASKRSYVTYLNVVRHTYFNLLVDQIPVALQTEATLKYLANHVNVMTGRGNLGKSESAAKVLAALLFSPKYWWSRLQVLGNLIYIPADAITGFHLGKKETRTARMIVAKEYVRMLSWMGALFSLAAFAKDAFDLDDEELSVNTDWRSSDFLKIRIANTRIDFMAGLIQNMVFAGRMVTDQIARNNGEVVDLKAGGQLSDTWVGEVARFGRSKLAPIPSMVWTLKTGEDPLGRKATWDTEIVGMYVPISVGEVYAGLRELGWTKGSAASLSNLMGIGVSTYGGKEDHDLVKDALMKGTDLWNKAGPQNPGDTFYIDQSRYEKEVKEKGWVIPKSKPLPTF